MKKFILIFIALIALSAISYFLISGNFGKTKTHLMEIWDAVPQNASYLVRVNDINRFRNNLDSVVYKDEFNHLTFSLPLLKLMRNLDSTLATFDVEVIPNKVYASYHLASVGQMAPVLYLPSTSNKRQFKKLKGMLSTDKNIKLNSWMYQDLEIFELTHLDLDYNVAFTFIDGIVIASQTSFLVEDAINELINNDNKLTNKASFKNLWNNSSVGADITIAFCYNNIALWLSSFLERSYIDQFETYKNMAEWSLIDLYFNEKGIFYTGQTTSDESNLLNEIKGNEPLPYDLLPANTAFFYQQILPKTEVSVWKGNHFIKIQGEVFDAAYSKKACLFLHNADSINNINFLQELAAETKHEKEVEDYKNYAIKSVWNENLIKPITGLNWNNDEKLFYIQLPNYIVFAKVKIALQLLIDQIENQHTLAKSLSFNELEENTAIEGEINTYIHTGLLREVLRNAASNIIEDEVDELLEALSHFRQFSLSYKRERALCMTSGYALYNKSIESRKDMLWKLQFNAPVITVKQVVDVIDKTNYILAQDSTNRIYFINPNGHILWEMDIKDPLVGAVYSADYFGNEKACLLFTTSNEVYWIDRTGQTISDFPMQLPDKTSTGLTMVETNGKTNFYVPVKNGNAYGYEANGKPLVNWNPKTDVGEIIHPIKLLNTNNKQYLIAANKKGDISVWNANGKSYFKTIKSGQAITNQFIFDETTNPKKLKTITKKGKVVAVTLDGKLTSAQLSFPFSVDYFSMADVVRSSAGFEIFVAGDKCASVRTRAGKKIFADCNNSTNTTYELLKLPYDNSFVIAAYDAKLKTVKYLDDSGALLGIAPKEKLDGAILFDMFGAGENNLVGWSDNNVTAFRLANGVD